MSQKLHISETTIKREIGQLKKNGIINRYGGRKNGYWKIEMD